MGACLLAAYGLLAGVGYLAALFYFVDLSWTYRVVLAVLVLPVMAAWGWAYELRESKNLVDHLLMVAFWPVIIVVSPLLCLIVLLWLCVVTPVVTWQSWQKERKFRAILREQGRTLNLAEFLEKLRDNEGTLIEELGAFGPMRYWWTAEDIQARGQLPQDEKVMDRIWWRDKPHAFNTECLDRYLDIRSGMAQLILVSGNRFPLTKLTREYPHLRLAKVIRPVADDWQEKGEITYRRSDES